MKLKKLIISGFKSFADKVTLNFGDGITGIVGPNGSGKSNVIDSVRWVMGEQNAKHLRGQVATDIIFAGSDKRKALGMTEVTLVFDNSDFSELCPPEYRNEPEISIGRRLYIDGQREYFINRKPCRLKDIVGFFTLTGLGGRSYSMIQQGQVDRILNAKPEDVRLILEEASGTLSYKSRRDACHKKLTKTQENLSRIDDIVSELERQLSALESQVETAKKWKELTDEVKTSELKLFGHNYLHFKKELVKLEQASSESTQKESELIAEVAQLEASLAGYQKQLADADPELDKLREKLTVIREAIVRSEGKIAQIFEGISQGEERLLAIEEEIGSEEGNLGAIREIIEGSERELALAQQEEQYLTDEVEALKDEMDRQDESAMVFRNREEQLRDDLKNLEMLLESNALRSEAIERDRKKSASEMEAFTERLSAISSDIAEHEPILAESEAAVSSGQSDVDDDVSAKSRIENAIIEVDEKIDEHRGRLHGAKEDLISSQTKASSLQEILSSQGSVSDALNRVIEEHPHAKNLALGILTDLISLDAERPLPLELTRAFDAWAERLLIDSVDHLESLLTIFSQDSMLPRIPMSVLHGQEIDLHKISEWAVKVNVSPLKSHLKNLSGLSLVDLFMERLFVCSDMSLSREFVESLPEGVTVFSDRGVIIQSSFDFLYESQSSKGILARKAEIEALSEQVLQAEELTQQLEEGLVLSEDHRSQLKDELQEVDHRLKEKNADILEVVRTFQIQKQELDHKRSQLEEAQRQYDHYKHSCEIFTKELESLGEARISLGGQREQLVEDAEGFKDESVDVLEMAEEVRRQYEAKRLELTQVKAKVQAKGEGIGVHQKQLDMMQSSFVRREEEQTKIKRDLESYKENEISGAEEMKALIAQREDLDRVITEKRSAHSELYARIKSNEELTKSTRNKLAALQKKESGSALEMERLKIALEGTLEQAKEKYEIELENYTFEEDPNFDTAEAAKEIQRLRSKIERLGNINMMAIEEYEKLLERNQFILAQKEDVESSISLLLEAIEEIEDSAKLKFLKVFEEINQNFAQLFPVLFPGGDARLHLTDDEDPLNGGVDILVRLPGKKMRSMTLFSGGEKALTAIALIFALLKTKPTPFCFLDEVDAPLDEANVGRYNKVLEFLAERFQFIVITHNRRTMEVLDQLYGVTMMEGGVSRVVGVDMSRDIPNHLKKAFKEESPSP